MLSFSAGCIVSYRLSQSIILAIDPEFHLFLNPRPSNKIGLAARILGLDNNRPGLLAGPTAWHSKIQHQPLALAAGAADHHARVLGLLFFAQDRVAVLRET